MRHSLLSRFQGTLLGAALGEILGANCSNAIETHLPWREIEQWSLEHLGSAAGWGRIAVEQTRRLGWNDRASSAARSLDQTPDSPTGVSPQQLCGANSGLTGGIAIATLPIALFHHEDLARLQYHLQQSVSAWQLPPNLAVNALVVSYTVSLALQERLQPSRLIPQLIRDLELEQQDSVLTNQLTQVQNWVTEGAGLTTATLTNLEAKSGAEPQAAGSYLSGDTAAIALALYGFLSTPEEPQLSLLRVARMQHQPQVACAIAGALSGAYNSRAGLPLSWRKAVQPSISNASPLSSLWGVPSEAELLQLAEQLFAQWSGIHPVAQERQHPYSGAAPLVIRAKCAG
jgi:ADP-ribosylglycohydrolase